MASQPHVLLFPFMAKGHIIPLLHLARLLLRHGAAVTVLTTPANRPFTQTSLPASLSLTLLDIPFPDNIPGIPPGVESTDKLPDISLLIPFAAATELMQPHFERILQSLLPNLTLIISDDFLHWTLDSANKFSIPRFVFHALGTFSIFLTTALARGRYLSDQNDLIFPDFPNIKLKKEDADPLFIDPKFLNTPYHDYVFKNIESSSRSHGIVMNTFPEFESVYVEKWNSVFGPKIWCAGPFCLGEEKKARPENYIKPKWIQWLDKQERGKGVLYIAFGTQIHISPEQFEEIKSGLDKSGATFLWAEKRSELNLEDGFEERMRERGIVVREWVDQREILEHESVKGFLNQCGWTSIMESVCAKVPILAMPAMWHHPLNAKLVAEELRTGVRVETGCGGVVESEGFARAVRELMEGEIGREARKNVAELGAAAVAAVEEGGSSWRSLSQLLSEFR